MKKTIYIVGIGGRTGAMFGRELRDVCEIVGVGMAREIEAIKAGGIKLRRGAAATAEVFDVEAILPEDFGPAIQKKQPDFIWLAVRNPVRQAVEFYYRHFAGKDIVPALILSQNGLSAVADAKAGLEAVLGQGAGKTRIIRVSLINGIDLSMDGGTAIIAYKTPVKLGFGAADGRDAADLKEIFNIGKFKCQEFRGNNLVSMENSKLFTNLIGMAASVYNYGEPKAAAVNGLSVSAGLMDKKVFQEEIAMLKEFVAAVKKSGSGFVADFCGYPINLLAGIITLPVGLLLPFRAVFARIVARGRNRPKDLSEIDYYNGEVVKLGKKFGVATPVNEMIVAKAEKRKA